MVILDMIMPVMSGRDLFERLKERDPQIKTLLSSGYSIDGQAAEILKSGCNGFIQKPFTLEALSQKIRDILDA
jgi:CheY-like chemotaxis protein